MRVITVNELADFTERELMLIYSHFVKQRNGAQEDSPERLTAEDTLANIRFVLAWRYRTLH